MTMSKSGKTREGTRNACSFFTGVADLVFSNMPMVWIADVGHVMLVLLLLVVVLLIYWPAGLALGIAVPTWLLLAAFRQLLWHRKSIRWGLKNIVLKPESGWLVNRLLRDVGADQPAGRVLEAHTRLRSYRAKGGVDAYAADLAADVATLARLYDAGALPCEWLVCSSLNRYLTGGLAESFAGLAEIRVVEGKCIYRAALKGYRPGRYKAVQRRMFGEVVSKRDVSVASAWKTVLIKRSRRL